MKNILMCILCAAIMISICVVNSNSDSFIDASYIEETAPVSTEQTTLTDKAIIPTKSDNRDTIELYITEMTVEQKVGQLFIVTPEALFYSDNIEAELNGELDGAVTEIDSESAKQLTRYNVGGIIMFASNIETPDQIKTLNESINNYSSISPFICIDEEGGSVARIANNENFDVPRYESMRDIGSSNELENAENVGHQIGSYLKEYGFNLNLAPVSDLDSGNPAIGSRAFSDGPRLTGNMVKSEIEGFHSVGVMCCSKHFPGHGGANGDTHNTTAEIDKTWEELCESDIVPFKYAIAADIDMIMIGHLSTPYITDDALPASLSYEMISEKLRGELGFNGVVITDAFAMSAITDDYSSAYAAVTAIKAGADIVLMPESFEEAYSAVVDAVNSGEITEDELNEHLKRVLELKEKYNLIITNA